MTDIVDSAVAGTQPVPDPGAAPVPEATATEFTLSFESILWITRPQEILALGLLDVLQGLDETALQRPLEPAEAEARRRCESMVAAVGTWLHARGNMTMPEDQRRQAAIDFREALRDTWAALGDVALVVNLLDEAWHHARASAARSPPADKAKHIGRRRMRRRRRL